MTADDSRGGNTRREVATVGANRLIDARSPYLLQHAHNPVNWFPWGEEAFEKAKSEDKPVFLSIGYSTCHWCHVMERESFLDGEVAALMNNVFVSIKVDREERPDIDSVYMKVCQTMTGSGGWPLTIVMTPEKHPFFAATYIPRDSRSGRLGMVDLIPRIGELWRHHRGEALRAADKVLDHLKRPGTSVQSTAELGTQQLHGSFRELESLFDDEHGGFRGQRKFPIPHNLILLLRYWKRTGEKRALEMVEKTLESMCRGGIYDHVGFGFHRYSTDPEWRLPHFEKMLYDQALVCSACLEAYQATRHEQYAETARQVLAYVLRDLTAPEGGFFCAEDADSEGEEGRFYLWTIDEVRDVLGFADADLVMEVFGTTPEGNFREELSGNTTGSNVLHISRPVEKVARELGISVGELRSRLSSALRLLRVHRAKRIRPALDDKVLTDWNGLMIASLAQGARLIGDDSYVTAARRAADFLLSRMRTRVGGLLHRYYRGDAGVPGNLDDYAFLVHGLIDLYQSAFDLRYLQAAVELNDALMERFTDPVSGAYFFTDMGSEELPHRSLEFYDGATPSGNSIQLLNLLRLAGLTAESEYDKAANRLIDAFAANASGGWSNHTQFLIGLDFAIGPAGEIVIVEGDSPSGASDLLNAVESAYCPSKVVLLKRQSCDGDDLARLAPFTARLTAIDGKPTAYVCSNHSCNLPTTDAGEMLRLLCSHAARQSAP